MFTPLRSHHRCYCHSQNHERLQLSRRCRLVRLRISPNKLLLPALLWQTLRQIPHQLGISQRASHIRSRIGCMCHGADFRSFNRGQSSRWNRRRWDCFWGTYCEFLSPCLGASSILHASHSNQYESTRFFRDACRYISVRNIRVPWAVLLVSRRSLRLHLEVSLRTR